MAGLAGKLSDVMSALGGNPVADSEEEISKAGDYGYRYLVRMRQNRGRSAVNQILSFICWWRESGRCRYSLVVVTIPGKNNANPWI